MFDANTTNELCLTCNLAAFLNLKFGGVGGRLAPSARTVVEGLRLGRRNPRTDGNGRPQQWREAIMREIFFCEVTILNQKKTEMLFARIVAKKTTRNDVESMWVPSLFCPRN